MKNKIVRIILAGALSASMLATNCSSVLAADVKKEETVYVKTDETGKATSVVVTDQLSNVSGESIINDVSELTDIENVKGDEKFTQKGNDITWENKGSEKIVYQGTTDKELPVGVKISYELDGKEITPKKLKGKSGHLKINVDYENATKDKEYTPFLMATIFVSDEKSLENVTVDGGKVLSDGERQTIIGYGIPGIKDFLEGSKNNDLIKDFDGELPEGFSLEADVKDYDNITCMSIAINDIFAEKNLDTSDGMNKLRSSMKELTDAAGQLASGSAELADGTKALKDAGGTLTGGVKKLDEGSSDLATGTGTLLKGSKDLKDGADSLAKGTNNLLKGVKTLYKGSDALDKGANKLAGGIKASKQGADKLSTGMTQVEQGAGAISQLAGAITASIPETVSKDVTVSVNNEDLRNAVSQVLQDKGITDPDTVDAILAEIKDKEEPYSATIDVKTDKTALGKYATTLTQTAAAVESGAKTLGEGATSLAGGLKELDTGASNLAKSTGDLKTGAKDLKDGIDTANTGAKELAKGSKTLWEGAKSLDFGASELSKGMGTLSSGSGELIKGVDKLNTGAIELRDGMKKFNDEGIGKINSIFGDDLEQLVNRINMIRDNAKDYKNCTGISEDMEGSVKFIFVTE